MWRRITIFLAAIIFAFGVLITSVLRTAAVKYEFSSNSAREDSNQMVLGKEDINIEYNLAYQGRVLPDHALWPLKALRDRVWLFINTNKSRKAELMLLFADKRLSSARVLFEREKYELGYSTLTKAEKYLENASNLEAENREEGIDTSEFLSRLAFASLKHYEVMEEDIYKMAPEDAKPGIIETKNYAISVYKKSRDALLQNGMTPPENPFTWD